MSDLAQHLRRTTEQMACSARVKRSLWNEHAIACLNSAKAIERLEVERDILRAALQYARNLVGPDEIIDAALNKGGGDE